VESLWDGVLSEKLRGLLEDLTRIVVLVWDEALLAPIGAHWGRGAKTRGRSAKGRGRPAVPMLT